MPPETRPITDADRELIEEATDLLVEFFAPGRHEVCCALRTGSGRTYSAINLRTAVGTAGVHCEPVCIANAIMDGEESFDTFVAVMREGNEPDGDVVVISACGVCREMIREYDPTADIVIPDDDGPVKTSVTELLPVKAY
jgi:cytidine deaminase